MPSNLSQSFVQQGLDFHLDKFFHPIAEAPVFITHYPLSIDDKGIGHSPAFECFLNLVSIHQGEEARLLAHHRGSQVRLALPFAANGADR